MPTGKTGDLPRNPRHGQNNHRGRLPSNGPALRRRAEAYRDKADALEAMLTDTQEQFTEAFTIADAQVSTRQRIASAARKRRNNAGRDLR